jgi:hypothetical protein
MKTILLTLILVAGIVPDPSCTQKLQAGYMFLKQIPVEPGADGYFETSYVFMKGTSYNLITCVSKEFSKMEVFNAARQKIFEINDKAKIADPIQYPCNATGIYYFRLYGGSGEFLLGFKRS